MAIEDLDLEFEDEEEAKKKKNEAVAVDVDLEFHVNGETKTKKAEAPKADGSAVPVNAGEKQASKAEVTTAEAEPSNVKNINEAKPKESPAAGVAQKVIKPTTDGSAALKLETVPNDFSQEVVQLRAQIQKVEVEAQVKVGVAEFKAEFLSEVLSDMKILDLQVHQLLVRINAKHPDVKNEVLQVKKLLADFVAKKRK